MLAIRKDTQMRIKLKEVLEFYGVKLHDLEACCDAAMFAIIRAIDEDKKDLAN